MPPVEEDFFALYFDITYHAQYFGAHDLEEFLGNAAKKYLTPSSVVLR
jgi:hypothetical protein